MSILELIDNISKSKEVKEKVDPILKNISPKFRVTILGGLMYENIEKLEENERKKVTANIINTLIDLVYVGEEPWD